MPTTEFDNGERVTAVMTSHTDDGSDYDGALTIGVYPESPDEVWLHVQGKRHNIQTKDVPELCKQLRRAARIAGEFKEPSHD